MKLVATATIGVARGGADNVYTNRVVLKSHPDEEPEPDPPLAPVLVIAPPPKAKARRTREPQRYLKDRSTRGRPYKTICVSIPVDDLAVIDAEAARLKMARSELLRAAARELADRNRGG